MARNGRPVDIRFVGCVMGGSWAIPETDKGRVAAEEWLGEAEPLTALAGELGYIVEPQDAGEWLDLAVTFDLVLRAPSGAIITRPSLLN